MNRAVLVCLAGLSLVSAPCWAAHKKPEPLPPQLLAAKAVFVERDSWDRGRSALEKWGRFQIVTDPAEAELIFDFDYDENPPHCSDSMVLTVWDGKKEHILYGDAKVRCPLTWQQVYINQFRFNALARSLVKRLRKRIEAQEKQPGSK